MIISIIKYNKFLINIATTIIITKIYKQINIKLQKNKIHELLKYMYQIKWNIHTISNKISRYNI